MRFRYGIAVALAVGLAVPRGASAQCTKDTDCKGDRICMKGTCVTPATAPAVPVPSAAPAAISPRRSEIIALYDSGRAESARDEAERAGDRELVTKLAGFLKATKQASDSAAADDRKTAIKNYETALAIDDEISKGASKYGAPIRKKLAQQWLAVAIVEHKSGNIEGARGALMIALKYDPGDPDASAQLAALAEAPTRRHVPEDDSPHAPTGSAAAGTSEGVSACSDATRVRLTQEREDLLSRRPGLAWPVTALVLGISTTVAAIVGLATARDDTSSKLWLFVLGFDAGFLIMDAADLIGALIGRSKIDDRVRELDRQLRVDF